MTFSAQYDAEQNTRKILAEAKHLSLRIDGRFIGISQSAMARPTTMIDGYLTTQFRVTKNLAFELGHAKTVGFAWLPAETSIFYGFDLPVSKSGDLVYSFINHCSDA
jgi:hypothetical protein